MNRIRDLSPVCNHFSIVNSITRVEINMEICSVINLHNALFSYKRKQKHEKI